MVVLSDAKSLAIPAYLADTPGRSADRSHLAVYGRSKGTRILHGPVRVWEGICYRVP